MFRKAQLRLFAMITAILIAIFIAVLGSINIIMQTVMQRQSKDVLKKIAAGVEYDEKISSFVITKPEDFGQKPLDRFDEPPSKPADEPVTTVTRTTSRSQTTTTAQETVSAETSQYTATTAAVQTLPPQTQPQQTTAAVTTALQTEAFQPPPPTEPVTSLPQNVTEPTEENKPTEPPQPPSHEHQGGDQPVYPPPWWEWWNNGGNNGGDNQFPPPCWNWQPYWNWQPFTQESHSDAPDKNNGDWNWDLNKQTAASPEELYGSPTALGLLNDNDNASAFENRRREGGDPDDQRRRDDQIPKSIGSIDFFIIMADEEGNYLAKLNNDDIDEPSAQSYINAILKEDVSSGMIDKKYQFYQMEKDNGTIMVFTDKSAELNVLSKLIRTTIIIGIISLTFLAAAAFFLSRQVMKPLKSAFEKQKQFISDASHELKTPLTVISANADVLSGEIGENRWLTYIKSQTDRMNVLVNDLLNLTRLENNSSDFIRTDFDLSKAVTNTALPFECQAFESSKDFEVDVEEGLTVNGSEKHIKQMTAIFIDNALKYSNAGGTVRVSLRKQGERKVLTVFNTGAGVKEGEEDKIFERFYRSDESRNRSTGGYGLGLAIAKSIIDKHKFKVHVENCEGKSISFVVTM